MEPGTTALRLLRQAGNLSAFFIYRYHLHYWNHDPSIRARSTLTLLHPQRQFFERRPIHETGLNDPANYNLFLNSLPASPPSV